MAKIIAWIGLNIATVLGIVQAVLKLLKEVLTGIVNTLFPLFPDNGKFETVVNKVRDIVNAIDEWVEKIKEMFLG